MSERMTVVVEAEGLNSSDLADALEQAVWLIREGYVSGFDRNERSQYKFSVEGADV